MAQQVDPDSTMLEHRLLDRRLSVHLRTHSRFERVLAGARPADCMGAIRKSSFEKLSAALLVVDHKQFHGRSIVAQNTLEWA